MHPRLTWGHPSHLWETGLHPPVTWGLHSATSHPRALFQALHNESGSHLSPPPTWGSISSSNHTSNLSMFDISITCLLHDKASLFLAAPHLKVSSCSCSSCVCSWRCLRPAGLFISSMESDWLSLSIRTWFSASKLLFSSCRAATCERKDSVKERREWKCKKKKGQQKWRTGGYKGAWEMERRIDGKDVQTDREGKQVRKEFSHHILSQAT